MSKLLHEVRALTDRQDGVVPILLAVHHPQLDRLARSIASSVLQTREILGSEFDKKLLAKIRAGYVQGWRDLPDLLRSIRESDAEVLISQISAMELDSTP
jgi:hypothetical protein